MALETDSNRGHISLSNASDLWINSPEISSHFVECDSVVYHDPIKKTNGYISGKNNTPPVVMQKKSVDKFSSQSSAERETLPEDITYAVADKAKITPPLVMIEGEVMSMPDDDDALYGVANKLPKISQQNSLENKLIDDGDYGKVNKPTKTLQQNGSQYDLFKNEPPIDYNDNIVNKCSDDLPSVIVSDEGNYTTDSDISSTTKVTMPTIKICYVLLFRLDQFLLFSLNYHQW